MNRPAKRRSPHVLQLPPPAATLIDLRLDERALGIRVIQFFFQSPDGNRWGYEMPVELGSNPQIAAMKLHQLAQGILTTSSNPPRPNPPATPANDAAPGTPATPA